MNRLFTVFLCSTYSDLTSEREAVIFAILSLRLQHNSMEIFGARPNLPIEACLEDVRKSAVLVVIVGHKYGSLVPNKDFSYTEAEYTEAYRLGKPCLVYFRDESVPILPKFMESDVQKLPLLQKFRELLASRHTIATFRDTRELASRVTTDINRTIQDMRKLPPELVEEWMWDGVEITNLDSTDRHGYSNRNTVMGSTEYLIRQEHPKSTLIIKDHGPGEIADYIVVYDHPKRKEVHLYFCSQSHGPRPGLRNIDLYDLAGQGNRSVDLINEPGFFIKILDHATRRKDSIVKGNLETVHQLASAGSENQYKFLVYLVQPGLSVSEVNQKGSSILVSCNKWLSSHGLVLKVIGS